LGILVGGEEGFGFVGVGEFEFDEPVLFFG
jgi:hypothetical protein